MAYDPRLADGPAPVAALGEGGWIEPGARYAVPEREGRAIRLKPGEALRIVTPEGAQVGDLFAVVDGDPAEMLSMEHTRTALRRLFPTAGDRLVTNRRRAILAIEEDATPARHDTLIACCDAERYRQLGAEGWHANCADNFRAALAAIGVAPRHVPAPLNLWMNIPVDAQGGCGFEPPIARPGDHILLRALLPAIVVLSACPMDMNPINARLTPLFVERHAP